MGLFYKVSGTTGISYAELKEILYESFSNYLSCKNILIIPPDFTRFHSKAGDITVILYEIFKDKIKAILPAIGTHFPMTPSEINKMFPGIPLNLFHVHNWRTEVITLGTVEETFVEKLSEGKVSYQWPAQINRILQESNFDLIISVGQVVPHEVIGMANYNKNIFIGTGGAEAIHKSHFLGAVYGMERIMGRWDNPVRKLLNYAHENFIKHLPLIFIHTVIGKDLSQKLSLRGLFIGNDIDVFIKAAELSFQLNFTMLDKPIKKVIVFLDPSEFKSTWLGNKSIYRTRMAIADAGELIVLAPGLSQFGEDKDIDLLIRKYGYRGIQNTLDSVNNNIDLQHNLSAAAHLIHGSSEKRFQITYCTEILSKSEIEGVGFQWHSYKDMIKKYNPNLLKEGYNIVGNEEIFFISNPALGLWAVKERFNKV